MAAICLTIDGELVEVEEGMTIFQAAKLAGIEIPHLCYHEALAPRGSCRMCLVELEGARGPVISCSYQAADGMVVETDTQLLNNIRKSIIELLLTDHPLDCMTCEKAGNCKLQDYAYKYGIAQPRFKGEQHEYPIDTSNPFIVRDLNKCILCGRCVSACDQLQVSEVLGFSQRGFDSKIIADNGQLLQDSSCVFCGRCVSVCPVGALTEKQATGKGRIWETQKVRTICNYCGCGCTIILHVKEGKIVKVESNLVVVYQHVCQMLHSAVLDRLRLGLLRITVMRCESDFRWIIQAKVVSNSFYDIIISMEFRPAYHGHKKSEEINKGKSDSCILVPSNLSS